MIQLMAGSDAGTVTNLIVRIRNGDADAIHELFPKVMLQLADKAERILCRFPRLARELTSHELINETYERVAQQLAGRDVMDTHHFIAIACQHFRWELLNRIDGPDWLFPNLPDQGPVTDDEFVDELEEAELILLACEAIDDLDDVYQRVINLRYWCDFTIREIAGELEMPTATVHRRHQEAIRQLRTRFPQDLSYE